MQQIYVRKQCLEFLFKNTEPIYEVIVVNNGSKDGTYEYLESLKDKIININNSENLGFSKANNQGAGIANGKYLVFLNYYNILCLSKSLKFI